jgi:membrane protease YdiL (CAAX protease family)
MASLTPAIAVFNLVFGRLIDPEIRWTSWIGDCSAVLIVGLTVVGYQLYARRVERRPGIEVQRSGCLIETAGGFGLSAALVVVALAAIAILGSYRVENIHPVSTLIHGFFVFGLLAFFEEIIFRVILLRLLEEMIGTWLAIVVVAAIFGGVHLIHDEATVLSAAAIAVQDLILSGAFVLTRRVWLSWGIHWGWNFVQDGILGMPNSSVDELPSLFEPSVSGPIWITGGGFGIELSIVGVLLNFGAGIVLMKMAVDRGQVMAPPWRR